MALLSHGRPAEIRQEEEESFREDSASLDFYFRARQPNDQPETATHGSRDSHELPRHCKESRSLVNNSVSYGPRHRTSTDTDEIRIESGPHPMGPPRRILAKALGQWLHSHLPPEGSFSKYHATQSNPGDLEQRSVNLLVARKTKKGDNFLLRVRPHTSAVPARNEAFQMLTHWVRQQPNGEVLYDAAPPGTEARHIASRARGHTNVKGRGRGQGNTKKQ